MSEPMTPALEDLGTQHFSFYPAILNIQHNEWLLSQTTWSEILVVNAETGMELWIPRRFVGELSSAEKPIVIVGLRKDALRAEGAECTEPARPGPGDEGRPPYRRRIGDRHRDHIAGGGRHATAGELP
jgi:hypothetical protein